MGSALDETAAFGKWSGTFALNRRLPWSLLQCLFAGTRPNRQPTFQLRSFFFAVTFFLLLLPTKHSQVTISSRFPYIFPLRNAGPRTVRVVVVVVVVGLV